MIEQSGLVAFGSCENLSQDIVEGILVSIVILRKPLIHVAHKLLNIL